MVLPEPPIRLLPPRSPHSAGARVSLFSVWICRRQSAERDLSLGVLRQGHPPHASPPARCFCLACATSVPRCIYRHPILVMPSHPGRLRMKQATQAAQEKLVPPSMYMYVRRAWPLGPCLADQSINPLRIHDDSAAGPGTRWQKPRTRAEGRQLQEAGFRDDRAPAPPCRAREKNQTVIAQISHRT